MRQDILIDRIQRALGRAARHVGAMHDVYRPLTPSNPLASANHRPKIRALFDVADENLRRSESFGHSVWQGLFDAISVRQGDYLVGPAGALFVAALPALQPAICVLTNRTVTFSRPSAPTAFGVDAYGGIRRSDAKRILENWPASLLGDNGRSDPVQLPGDGLDARAVLLLPRLPHDAAEPRTADLVSDDRGYNWVVGTIEYSSLGWRISLRQAGA